MEKEFSKNVLKRRHEPWKIFWTYVCVASLVILSVQIYRGAYLTTDFDNTAPLLLAREQRLSGSFFPPDWYYGNSTIWISNIIGVLLPLSFLIQDQMTLKICATLTYTLLSVLFVYFCCKTVFKSKGAALICIPLIFCTHSSAYSYVTFYSGLYSNQLLIFCLLLIFLVKATDDHLRLIRANSYVLLLILCLWASIEGIRAIEGYTLPLMCAIFFYFLYEWKNSTYHEVKRYAPKALGTLLPIVIASGLGLGISLWIQAGHMLYGNTGVISIATSTQLVANVANYIRSILVYMGFQEGVAFFSLAGIISLIKIVASAVLCVIFPVALAQKYKTESKGIKLSLWFFFVFSMIQLLMMIFYKGVWTDKLFARYLNENIVLGLLLSGYYVYRYIWPFSWTVKIFSSMCILALLFSSVYTGIHAQANFQSRKAELYEVSNVLQANGLTFGYSDILNSETHTALSNFDVEVVPVELGPNLQIRPFSFQSSARWYTPEYHEGETFLLLSVDEYREFTQNQALERYGNPTKVIPIGTHMAVVYDHNISLDFWTNSSAPTNLVNMMYYTDGIQLDGEKFIIPQGETLFGPYIDLSAGEYLLTFDCAMNSKNANAQMIRITAELGQTIISEEPLKEGMNNIQISLDSSKSNVEFVLNNIAENPLFISNIKLIKQS